MTRADWRSSAAYRFFALLLEFFPTPSFCDRYYSDAAIFRYWRRCPSR